MDTMTLTFLGTRGTIAVEDPLLSHYGGATLCVLLFAGDACIVLDGGTGLYQLPRYLNSNIKDVHLLLSHPHVDHLCGIPSCPSFLSGNTRLHMYAAPCEGLGVRQQLGRLMSPPLWPVGPEVFHPEARFVDIEDDFSIGPVSVRLLSGAHPGGCTVFRLDYQDKSLVYATDFELALPGAERLEDFARDCTLLLCDGQYSEEELPRMRQFGHSSWMETLGLAKRCGAGRLGIIHHAPWRTDQELDDAQAIVESILPGSFFAHKGACITL